MTHCGGRLRGAFGGRRRERIGAAPGEGEEREKEADESTARHDSNPVQARLKTHTLFITHEITRAARVLFRTSSHSPPGVVLKGIEQNLIAALQSGIEKG